MTIYTLYIEDDRYSVPTLLALEQPSDGRVMQYMSEMLASSPHYLAADVWDGDRHVGRIEGEVDVS